ncbi:hypothetical protein [Archangium violaceum]|uniref:hypothetical protein n=1 Tax=Archangium violaceum TaxID=83451 RepID=UPI0036DE2452
MSPSDDSDPLRRRLLELKKTHPLPPELAGPVPRKDVWGETGYLNQPRYHSVIKPMLLRGHATVGIVYNHHVSRDGVDQSVTAEYAWLDERGNLRTDVIHEEFDVLHAALASGRGDIVFSIDAELGPGKVITLLFHPDTEMHMIYEAVRADPEWERKRDRSYRVFHLRWESSTEDPRALGSREPEDPPLFTLEKRQVPGEGWWLLHGEEVILRTVRERPLAEGGMLRLLDARGEEVGRVEVEGTRLRVTLRSEEAPFFITEESGNMWMLRDSQHHMRVMTLLPDTPGPHLWQCVPRDPMERSRAELFTLAFVAAHDGPAPFPFARGPRLG